MPFSPRRSPRRPARGLARLEFALTVAATGTLVALALGALGQLQAPSHEARLLTLAAQMQTAATLFHARCLMQSGQPEQPLPRGSKPAAADCESVQIDGAQIAGVHGYPAATLDGIVRLTGLDGPATGGSALVFSTAGQQASIAIGAAPPAPRTCQFTYTQAPTPGTAPMVDTTQLSCRQPTLKGAFP